MYANQFSTLQCAPAPRILKSVLQVIDSTVFPPAHNAIRFKQHGGVTQGVAPTATRVRHMNACRVAIAVGAPRPCTLLPQEHYERSLPKPRFMLANQDDTRRQGFCFDCLVRGNNSALTQNTLCGSAHACVCSRAGASRQRGSGEFTLSEKEQSVSFSARACTCC